MPPKSCKCAICSQEVLKAQTYHVGDGQRACKSHPGVLEKSRSCTELQQAKALQKGRVFQRRPEPVDLTPRCWRCKTKGLMQRDFFFRRLIEMEKARKVYGIYNIFDLSHPANKHDDVCLFIIPKEQCAHFLKKLSREFESLVEMAGVAVLCPRCLKMFGIEAPLPKLDWEALEKGMVVAEVIRPLIQKMATAELVRDN